jgi:exodeoxyribonuclease-3
MPISVATINVNGIRAAIRKGMLDWVATNEPTVLALQEVRAPHGILAELLGQEWNVVETESDAKGRAGVAIASRHPIAASLIGIGGTRFVDSGRWIEATLAMTEHPLTIISAYVHTGDAADPDRMKEKLEFLDHLVQRCEELSANGEHVVLTGDLNVARAEIDIKNWKGNRGKAGFLPEERAFLDRIVDELGWADLGRDFGGSGPGPYTWWSYRGKAYDNDAGWRIDYQFASPALAATATGATVDRSMAYADRWSDHAPLTVTFSGLEISDAQ